MFGKLAPEAKRLANSPFVALRELYDLMFQATKDAGEPENADAKIVFDKDGNPTLNFHSKEAREEFERQLDDLSKHRAQQR